MDKKSQKYILAEEKFDIGTQLAANPKRSYLLPLQCGLARSRAYVGTKLFQVTALQNLSYIASCLRTAKTEFKTAGDFRNQYSVNFLSQNLCCIL
jgi:hypothetical protein